MEYHLNVDGKRMNEEAQITGLARVRRSVLFTHRQRLLILALAVAATSCSGGSNAASPAVVAQTVAPISPAVAPAPIVLASANASSADDFVAAIGINTHFSYVNTVYGQYLTMPAANGRTIVSALETLGVRHIRDGSMNTEAGAYRCPIYQQLASAGVDVDAVISNTATTADVADMALCLGPALFALEGPNELDAVTNFNPAFAQQDVGEMQMLRAARGSAYASAVKLFGPTTVEAQSDKALAAIDGDVIGASIDYANGQAYFGDHNPESAGWGGNFGFGSYGALSTDIASMEFVSPGKPYVSSETGYTDRSTGPTSVTAGAKAAYLLRDLLLHWKLGAKYVYIYELAPASESWSIMDENLNPKPSYTAVQNLIAILKDPGPPVPSGHLLFSIVAAPDVDQLVFRKRDGSYWLVLWQTDPIADANTGTPLTVAPTVANIALANAPSDLRVYTIDPQSGSATSTRLPSSAAVSLSITTMPEILQIGKSTAPVIH
jgi:hypothetical protein